MVVLFRLTMMLVGYAWACVAAALVLALGSLAPGWSDLGAPAMPPDMQSAVLWTVVAVAALMIFAVALLPALAIIALTEGLALRSIVIYGALGGVLGLLMTYGLDVVGYSAAAGSALAHDREVFAAAGIAGGLVYWAFAGRRAGIWTR